MEIKLRVFDYDSDGKGGMLNELQCKDNRQESISEQKSHFPLLNGCNAIGS